MPEPVLTCGTAASDQVGVSLRPDPLHVLRIDVCDPPVQADSGFRRIPEDVTQILADPGDALGFIRPHGQGEQYRWTGRDHILKPSLSPAKLILQLPALGDVEERDHRAEHHAIAQNRKRPILGWKTGAVRPPEKLMVHMGTPVLSSDVLDRAFLSRIRSPV